MTTILVEAFGRLSPYQDSPNDVLDEDLYSIFLARSELMGWCTISTSGVPDEASLLWDMHEAELTYQDDQHRIGFAQVGLNVGLLIPIVEEHERVSDSPGDLSDVRAARLPTLPTDPPTDPVLAIPPVVQCLYDSLRWFGQAEIDAVQVTAFDIAPRQQSYLHRLVSVLNWFNIGAATEPSQALVTVAADQWSEGVEVVALSAIRQTNTGSFEFGSLVSAPAECAAGPDSGWLQWARTNRGLNVSMPDWSPATIGWMIARIFDVALSLESAPQDLSVRVTRTVTE